MEICKAPTLRFKALNKHTHIMYIETENVIQKNKYVYIDKCSSIIMQKMHTYQSMCQKERGKKKKEKTRTEAVCFKRIKYARIRFRVSNEYITPITRHCHANILPSTGQENNTAQPKPDK